MKPPLTSSDVIDAVGGTRAFAQWWGTNEPRVSTWRRRGFPSALFLAMSERLRKERQINAAPTAWNMRLEAAE